MIERAPWVIINNWTWKAINQKCRDSVSGWCTLSDVVKCVLVKHALDDVSGLVEARRSRRTEQRLAGRRMEETGGGDFGGGGGDGEYRPRSALTGTLLTQLSPERRLGLVLVVSVEDDERIGRCIEGGTWRSFGLDEGQLDRSKGNQSIVF